MRATSDEDKADNWRHTTWITAATTSRNGKRAENHSHVAKEVCRTSVRASDVIRAVKASLGYTQSVDDDDRW